MRGDIGDWQSDAGRIYAPMRAAIRLILDEFLNTTEVRSDAAVAGKPPSSLITPLVLCLFIIAWKKGR